MSIEFSVDNPFRPPSWRWERAQSLVDAGSSFNRRIDDADVRRAASLYRVTHDAGNDSEVMAIASRDPALYWAYRVFSGGDANQTDLRHELEARILSQDTVENISSAVCMSAKTIQTYERVFFNVAERIKSPGYIMHQVLGTAVHTGLRGDDYPVLWKLFGYFGGPVVLGMIITQHVDPQRPTKTSELRAFVENDASKAIMRAAMIAAKTVRITSNELEIFEQFTKLLAVENSSVRGAGGEGQNTYTVNLNVAMTSLKAMWRVGGPTVDEETGEVINRRATNSVAENRLHTYDLSHVELRAAEQTSVALGSPDSVDLNPDDWQFPERRPGPLPEITDTQG